MTDELTTFIDKRVVPFDLKLNEDVKRTLEKIQSMYDQYTDVLERSNLSMFEMKDFRKDIAALKYLHEDLNNVITTYNSLVRH